ncbi:MAG: hypothetical protein ACJ73S_13665 [Mycobacteriales bacterium]
MKRFAAATGIVAAIALAGGVAAGCDDNNNKPAKADTAAKNACHLLYRADQNRQQGDRAQADIQQASGVTAGLASKVDAVGNAARDGDPNKLRAACKDLGVYVAG